MRVRTRVRRFSVHVRKCTYVQNVLPRETQDARPSIAHSCFRLLSKGRDILNVPAIYFSSLDSSHFAPANIVNKLMVKIRDSVLVFRFFISLS